MKMFLFQLWQSTMGVWGLTKRISARLKQRMITKIRGLIAWLFSRSTLDILNTLTQMFSALVTAAALFILTYQTYLQEETSNRSWAADRLAVIYSKDVDVPLYVRQEAVRAYVLLHRDLGMRRVLFWLRRQNKPVLSNTTLSGMTFKDLDFARATLAGATMHGANFPGSNLSGTDLRAVKAQYATFVETDLSEARLSGANLVEADFSNAHLEGSQFCEFDVGLLRCLGPTDARNANFNGAVFDASTKFCDVNISGAKLSGTVGLTQEHLDCNNILDDETTLPKGVLRH